jgi:hypothetical protein
MLAIITDSTETGRYPVSAKSTQISRLWILPTYDELFSQLIQKIKDLINYETANAFQP